MGWVKNRDRLHEAALSSIKSISKKKEISSKNGIAQRPPLLNQASIFINTKINQRFTIMEG